jgi:hypothetical protein
MSEKTIYTFSDDFFTEEFNNYIAVRAKGLKKQSNKMLENLMKHFDKTERSVKIKITEEFCLLRELCDELCEDDVIRNPQYFLAKRLIDVLDELCKENSMPHLRWCYELTSDVNLLEKAYTHTDCDEKTVLHMANHYIDVLWYGSHHFSEDVCLLDKIHVDEILYKMKQLIEKYNIKNDEYLYYVNLYSDWWLWSEKVQNNEKHETFYEWCGANNREYEGIAAYYYKG